MTMLICFDVTAPPVIYAGPASIKATSTEETVSFNCTATGLPAPSITWTFVDASGTEASLSHSTDYKIENEITTTDNELSVTHSTLTFVHVAPNTVGKVVCKAQQPGIDMTTVTAEALISVLGGSVENNVEDRIQLGQLVVCVVVVILVILVVFVSVLTLCISVKHRNQKFVSKV